MQEQPIIIIPAYNEEESIAAVINGIKTVVSDADILVVNDGGEDRTAESDSRDCKGAGRAGN